MDGSKPHLSSDSGNQFLDGISAFWGNEFISRLTLITTDEYHLQDLVQQNSDQYLISKGAKAYRYRNLSKDGRILRVDHERGPSINVAEDLIRHHGKLSHKKPQSFPLNKGIANNMLVEELYPVEATGLDLSGPMDCTSTHDDSTGDSPPLAECQSLSQASPKDLSQTESQIVKQFSPESPSKFFGDLSTSPPRTTPCGSSQGISLLSNTESNRYAEKF